MLKILKNYGLDKKAALHGGIRLFPKIKSRHRRRQVNDKNFFRQFDFTYSAK